MSRYLLEIARCNCSLYWEQSWSYPGQPVLERKIKMKLSSQPGAGSEPALQGGISRALAGMEEQKEFCAGWSLRGGCLLCTRRQGAGCDPPFSWLEIRVKWDLSCLQSPDLEPAQGAEGTCCLGLSAGRGDEWERSGVGRRDTNAGCYPVNRYHLLFIRILWTSLFVFSDKETLHSGWSIAVCSQAYISLQLLLQALWCSQS